MGSASFAVMILAVAFGLFGGLLYIGGNQSLRKPMVHDGIGGKDTNNLMSGCFGVFMSLGMAFTAVVLLLVSGGLFLAGL